MDTNQKPTAFVTGASKGIGKSLALSFLKKGYKVVALARSIDTIEDENFKTYLETSDYLPLRFDLSKTEDIAQLVSDIPLEFKNIEVLVNNAGTLHMGTLEVSHQDFRSSLAVNLEAPFILMKEILPLMVKQQKGTVINIASLAAKEAFSGFGGYAASKYGLLGLSESLFNEYSAKGIKVTTLCPSWMDTDMAQKAGTPYQGDDMIQASDIMKTIEWIMSLSPSACVKEVVIQCAIDVE